jgi:hypothetical protein
VETAIRADVTQTEGSIDALHRIQKSTMIVTSTSTEADFLDQAWRGYRPARAVKASASSSAEPRANSRAHAVPAPVPTPPPDP